MIVFFRVDPSDEDSIYTGTCALDGILSLDDLDGGIFCECQSESDVETCGSSLDIGACPPDPSQCKLWLAIKYHFKYLKLWLSCLFKHYLLYL